jgi:hypothetical protein
MPCSNLAHGFNQGLCFALNKRDEGLSTHLAILHADISAPWWVDILYDEMLATGADWIAAISPIKDVHGTTSTAISCIDSPWNPWCRITMREIHGLPETFSVKDLGEEGKGYALLLNTGCMLIDLRKPWFKEVGDRGELAAHFEIRNRIVFIPGKGWCAQTETEDWLLSRVLNEAGAKLFATRKVKLRHYGELPFTNEMPWGDWDQDQCGVRASQPDFQKQAAHEPLRIHEHGYWLDDAPDGALFDSGLASAIVEYCGDVSVADAGCGRCHYLKAMQAAGINCCGFDGNPDVRQWAKDTYVVDLAEKNCGLGVWDRVLCLEVGEHIPQKYESIFLDNICYAARHEVILSWAVPGQIGQGHVNCQTNEYVEAKMLDYGFARNRQAEQEFRKRVNTLPYFRETLMVYYRIETVTDMHRAVGELLDHTDRALHEAIVSPVLGEVLSEDRNNLLLQKAAAAGEACRIQKDKEMMKLVGGEHKPQKLWEPNPRNRFLVYLSSDGSCKAELFGNGRLFDVAVNRWKGPDPFANIEAFADWDFSVDEEKFYSATHLLDGIWQKYEAVCFLDDDVELSTKQINQLFQIGYACNLDLWQPALSIDSVNCWPHLAVQNRSIVRNGRFVELMMPFFRRRGLEQCIDTFQLTESGWGLAYLWPEYRVRIGIVDGVQACHMRPLKQPIGCRRMPNGKTQREEDDEIIKQYRIDLAYFHGE